MDIKHEVLLCGGRADGRVAKTVIGSRGIVIPVGNVPPLGIVLYRATDQRIDGQQVFATDEHE